MQFASSSFTSSDGSNIKPTRTSFFEHRTNLNVFIYWWSNSNTLFLASIDRTSNFEPNRAFTRFTKLLFQLARTSLFWTSNELEHDPQWSKNAIVLTKGCWSKIHMACERGLHSDIKKQSIFQKCRGKKSVNFRVQFGQGSPVPFHLA